MAIALKFTGSDEGARATAEALAKTLDQLGMSADKVKFDVATKGSTDLYGSLRNLKAEAVQHERVFGFFGRQLAQTGLVARETATSMVGLATGLAGSLWLLAAAEGVKLLAEGFKLLNKDANDALEKTKKEWDAFADHVSRTATELAEKVRFFGKPEGYAAYSKATDALAAAQERLAEAEARAAAATSPEEWGLAGREVAKYQKEVDKLTKTVAEAGSGLASGVQLKGLEAGAKASEDARKKEAADWKAFQDSLVAEGVAAAIKEAQAEAKIREDARKKEEAEILAWQKEMERIEGPEAQRKGERALQDYEQKRREEALAEQVKYTQQLAAAGYDAASAFASVGEAIGGQAGKMSALFGKLIQQAIQLAIAISATGGPFAWLNIAASAAAILATIASVPKFQTGTPYVPRTGLAFVHEGERIIPADENRRGGGGMNVTINASALDEAWWQKHQGEIIRTLSRAAGNRRTR